MSNKPKVVGRDFKFGTYTISSRSNDDAVVVKEYVHLDNGEIHPNLKIIENFKRPFWVTKEGYRNHTDKKEWEEENRVRKFESTQRNLAKTVARALNKPSDKPQLRMLALSQYLYGTDIPVTSLIKDKYMTTWPKHIGVESTVAVLDIETDVVYGHEKILMTALTFGSKCIISITKEFLGSIVDPVDKVKKAFTYYLGQYEKDRNIKLEVHIAKDEVDMCRTIFQRAHEWSPDFIAIWNMAFDLPRIEKALNNAGFDAKDILSDPRVPDHYKKYKFTEGPTHMVTQSGKPKKMLPAERWHNVECTAGFYFIDAMCLYKRVRIAEGNEISYALDYILDKNLGVRKLKFEEVKETGLRWHQKMQSEYKIEYAIYNLFDCISVELLDEKTGDIKRAFPALCGMSDFSRFKSNPKRIADDLHFFCRDAGKVIASFADNVATEFDNEVVQTQDWIITLASHAIAENGICLFDKYPNIRSTLFVMVADWIG